MAPEHRQSMQLKWHEMRGKEEQEPPEALERPKRQPSTSLDHDEKALRRQKELQPGQRALLGWMLGLPYTDIIDESDEVLHLRCATVTTAKNCFHSLARVAREHTSRP